MIVVGITDSMGRFGAYLILKNVVTVSRDFTVSDKLSSQCRFGNV